MYDDGQMKVDATLAAACGHVKSRDRELNQNREAILCVVPPFSPEDLRNTYKKRFSRTHTVFFFSQLNERPYVKIFRRPTK